ncbi:uncharacterized protein LOC129772327 [Toxorhynchites rutilus septentrionalis]|uniref:uncharacterized protein LOC129772327 n=1 Tax=Toxorhynchites rutilus septentrionalis TaxID=329112 RepID=UPI002479451E|nr:uncharacterized protein LOC129772327 [Toxorhynchites rutilus septentrionalis]XP_055632176.1 uncharacterized protein LOC129772327 [Toxorhynchites rutilus septentrionalis]
MALLRWRSSRRMKRMLLILLSGVLTLLTTAKAKPAAFSLQLSQIPGFTQLVERKLLEAMKSYSERRLDAESLRMIYYHDQTVAVVELGPQKRLIGCELIEVYNDAEGHKLLNNLTSINRPLGISFRDMIKLMEQCEQIDRINAKNNFRPTRLPPNTTPASNSVGYRIDDGNDEGGGGESDSTTAASIGIFKLLAHRTKDQNANRWGILPFTLFSGIIPGTKWCGTGDIADSYHDLGEDATMDRCCRTHDLCPLKVRAYQKRYNLSNNSIYTKSHCKCDDMLYECLKKTNTSAAQVMGSIYFNLVQVPCVEDTPTGMAFRKAREGF